MRLLLLPLLSSLLLLSQRCIVNAQQPNYSNNNNRGQVPVPGKPVYIKQTNSIWVFSFSKNIPADNKLSFIDLNQSFNTLAPPVVDMSSLITNNQCPVMHFAQAIRDDDGVSINIFGAGSDVNGNYLSAMTLCQFNTQTSSWKQINRPNNAPPARRNAAFEITQSGLTVIWGGSSEPLTGLSPSVAGYPNLWHPDLSIYDSGGSGWVNGPVYNGPPRANATITQISDTNGQLVIIGGAVVNNSSAPDMVTNFPLANMSDIIVLDPRTSRWTNIAASGNTPTPRKHHTTTLHPDGHTLILIGGETFNSSGAYLLNDVWTLDTSNMNNYTWTQVNTGGNAGLYRSNHTSILVNDQIWVIAGSNSSAKAVDIQLLNVTDYTWSFNAVSTNNVLQPYASIGGVKGLVGIVVGVVGGCLLLCSFFAFWWCRRRRVDPSSSAKLKPSNSGMIYADTDGHLQQSMIQQQHHEHYNSSPQPQDTSTLENSKITSRPSLSTTTSGGIAPSGVDWHNPMHINSFATNATSSPTAYQPSYYIPQYTAGAPIIPITDQQHYYSNNDNYYSNDGYHVDNTHPPPFGSSTGAVYTPDTAHRQSLVGSFWESALQQQQHPSYLPDGNAPDHNFMLTPLHESSDAARPSSRVQQSQVLQKPNEVDATNLNMSPTTGSTTVYTSSTNEENRSIALGNSDDPIYGLTTTQQHQQ